MECRPNCGACCIAPSLPGMPEEKPAGIRCSHLSHELKCLMFGSLERPGVCSKLKPTEDLCGVNRKDALTKIEWLEKIQIFNEP